MVNTTQNAQTRFQENVYRNVAQPLDGLLSTHILDLAVPLHNMNHPTK